jgi:probable rRNA maturation factor
MIEVEVLGARGAGAKVPAPVEVRRLSVRAAAAAGVHAGHLAIEFVGPERIAELNGSFRGRPQPTDVLSFPVDGDGPLGGPVARELGDVIVCPQHARDVREAIVHGVLHLVGFDHETDDGEMLALQRELLASKDG